MNNLSLLLIIISCVALLIATTHFLKMSKAQKLDALGKLPLAEKYKDEIATGNIVLKKIQPRSTKEIALLAILVIFYLFFQFYFLPLTQTASKNCSALMGWHPKILMAAFLLVFLVSVLTIFLYYFSKDYKKAMASGLLRIPKTNDKKFTAYRKVSQTKIKSHFTMSFLMILAWFLLVVYFTADKLDSKNSSKLLTLNGLHQINTELFQKCKPEKASL